MILGLGRSTEEGNDYPLQYLCLENNFMDRGAWHATVHGMAKQSLLLDFKGSLCQGKTFSSHLSLRYWMYQFVASMGRLPCYQSLWLRGQRLCSEIESEATPCLGGPDG